jgi:hypothetical protein
MYERKSMNKPWSDSPNARYIDWVLASIKKNPEIWYAAWEAVEPAVLKDVAWIGTRNEVRNSARAVARAVAWDAARNATDRSSEVDAAARHVLAALIAYDDCDQYLALGYEKLKVYAVLSEKPQAILLLPMAYVREKLNEQALV